MAALIEIMACNPDGTNERPIWVNPDAIIYAQGHGSIYVIKATDGNSINVKTLPGVVTPAAKPAPKKTEGG